MSDLLRVRDGDDKPPPDIPVRVVVADDHELVRASVARILASAGMIVAGTAQDGRQAVELAFALRPDVVLMDLGMPVLDGVEATRQLMLVPDAPPVVALTGSADLAGSALGAGAVACVFKDAEPAELVRVVRAASASRLARS